MRRQMHVPAYFFTSSDEDVDSDLFDQQGYYEEYIDEEEFNTAKLTAYI